jgi:predicted dienelactone hydrolase
MKRRAALTTLAALLAAAALPLRADDQFDTLDFDWQDDSRTREVPVRLYLPRAASRLQPVPLVVFSHGIGGSRRGYSYLGQHFASNGVASLHLQHVGSDRSLWTGNVFSLIGRLQDAAQEREAIHRAHDFRFALDRLLAGDNGAAIDRGRIVAAGHSYGANTTLLVCGAAVQRDGGLLALRDERVRAAIVISAPPFYGEADMRRILAPVQVPSVHITATDDVIQVPGYHSGAEDRLAVFDATGGPRKWLAVFEGGSHSIFTDRGGTGGPALNPQVKAATKELSLAFVRAVLDGDETSLRGWPQRHAGLVARFSAPA